MQNCFKKAAGLILAMAASLILCVTASAETALLQEAARLFAAENGQSDTIVDSVELGDYGFVAARNGDGLYTLYGFQREGGVWACWLETSAAIFQAESGEVLLLSNETGKNAGQVDMQYIQPTLGVILSDGEVYRKYTSYTLDDGVWRLSGCWSRGAGENFALYAEGDALMWYASVEERSPVGVVSQGVERDLRRADLTALSAMLTSGAADTDGGASSAGSAWNGPSGYHAAAGWPVLIDEYTAVVSNPNAADRLHLRAEPDKSVESLGKYYNGVHVIINGDISGEWVEVAIGSLTGYMMTQYLAIDGSAVESAMPVMEVSNPNPSANLHLREAQSTDSKSLGLYPNGTKVILMGFDGEWAHVIVGEQIGFMLGKYLK